MFRCRHCEFLQTALDRARSDARQDLAIERSAHEKELARSTTLLNEALRRNDVLQLAVLQGVGSAAGSAYVSRIDGETGDDRLPEADDEALPKTAAEMSEAPFSKIKRAEMLADHAKWIHKKREESNLTQLANPPGSFVRDPRPENDLAAK